MINLVIFISVFLVSYLLVGGFRMWSEAREIVDVPNERSSHERPTPVGAGLVIVALTLFSLAAWEIAHGNGFR
ncbi:MAG: glycosyl transferase, partial [Acidobacteriota bacterium]|nr:glycosyl transferase [Acidobacteriota bacterium]